MSDYFKTNYEKFYDCEEYFWGLEPADLCYEIIKLVPPSKEISVLDIGCGEGKDAVFMAQKGYNVTAFDITSNGIKKTIKLAKSKDVQIDAYIDDINTFTSDKKFDVIYSTGTIQYLRDDEKANFFKKIQNMTKLNGINWLNVFVDKPFIPIPPDWDHNEKMWQSGELFTYYPSWKFEKIDELIFDCNSASVPHKHAMDILIARKIKSL